MDVSSALSDDCNKSNLTHRRSIETKRGDQYIESQEQQYLPYHANLEGVVTPDGALKNVSFLQGYKHMCP